MTALHATSLIPVLYGLCGALAALLLVYLLAALFNPEDFA